VRQVPVDGMLLLDEEAMRFAVLYLRPLLQERI